MKSVLTIVCPRPSCSSAIVATTIKPTYLIAFPITMGFCTAAFFAMVMKKFERNVTTTTPITMMMQAAIIVGSAELIHIEMEEAAPSSSLATVSERTMMIRNQYSKIPASCDGR